jgi:hypothetical protein
MTKPSLTALAFAAAMLWLATGSGTALARSLEVGPGRTLKAPSEAARIAIAGDVIRIDPGTYVDCAIWTAPRLVIESTGPGVTLAGKTCADKAIFVIEGSDVTVRGITFANARVLWHNGAGIRAAGANLTVEHSRFIGNENGILAGGTGTSVLRITDSDFIGNGACIDACAHGVYAGAPILLLEIERCVFRDTKIGHHIKSRALNTILRDNRIEDGMEGTSSYLIDIPNGGNVLIEGNVLEKGALSSNPGVAISIGSEGVKNPTGRLIVRGNQFVSRLPGRTIFVRNSAAVPVQLGGNRIEGDVRLLAAVAIAPRN